MCKKIILTNRFCVNDHPILTPKVAKFDKTDFWDLKYPLEVWIEHKKCSTIYGTPVPTILNHQNSTGSTGGAREGQNMAHLGHINYYYFFDPLHL